MEDLREDGETSKNGYVLCDCAHHPNLRWQMKDPRTMHQRISQNLGVLFLGDITRQYEQTWPNTGSSFTDEEKKKLQDDGWTFECSCDFDDLRVLKSSSTDNNEDEE